MNQNIDHEKIFFNYFLSKPSYLKSLNVGFFGNIDLDNVARISKKFYLEFGEAPSKEQMKALADSDSSDIPTDIIDSIYDINIKRYDIDWVKRTAEAWAKWKHFDKSLVKTIEYVKTQTVSPENVEDVVNRAINMISSDGSINFDTDVGLDFFNPESHVQSTTEKLTTGWNFIDNVSGGGYSPKSLVVYAGEQNVGKCLIYNTIIKIRNKKTKEVIEMKIGDFYNLVKNSKSNNGNL